MAEGKKSFVLYADLLSVVDKMPDEKAGELLKHILRYVNDLNPETDDLLVQIAFEPIKNQLKRDLKKWEDLKIKRSEAGRKSAEARARKVEQKEANSTSVKSVEQSSTNSTVNDTVTVNVNVNDNVNDKEEYYHIINEKLKLSFKDYKKLLKTYSPSEVDAKIYALENYEPKKRSKYKSMYLTLNRWLLDDRKKQEEKQAQKEEPKQQEYKFIRDATF